MGHLLETGMLVDGFRVLDVAHQGGMATLWRVVAEGADAPPGMPLLMKVPRIRADDPTGIVSFEVERMIMPRLQGPHVPRFIAAGDYSTLPYIVMEQIPGSSVRSRNEASPLTVAEVAALGAKVALALHDLHRQHVIHFDIKPSNILIRPDGTIVLIDFGLARHDELPDLLAEEFRLPLGTGPYISPEQLAQVRNEPRSDLFSLGVMLYFLATGERPFGNPTNLSGLRSRLYRDARPPRVIRPKIPPWFQEIILRCLEVEASARHASAAQLASDLQHSDQVVLTERAERTRRDNVLAVGQRWLKVVTHEAKPEQSARAQLTRAPIIMVALDLAGCSEALAETLRTTAIRILLTEPGARLACVTILKTHLIGMDILTDANGDSLHVKRLVELKHWARGLDLPPDRLTYHVLEAPDPAAALIEYARSNRVDHIIIGSRGSSVLRRYLGSVSTQVVAEADCTVTVVKNNGIEAAAD